MDQVGLNQVPQIPVGRHLVKYLWHIREKTV